MAAVVILPDHLHCLWTLPLGDSDFSTRWGLIKGHFSRAIEKGERVSQSRGGKPEGDEEGYVHIHAGIHGIGDLPPEVRDWRNPVARVAIRRVN
ncbi:MAG: hypothetical protein ACRET3_03595 [Burkholderiales bacterium]